MTDNIKYHFLKSEFVPLLRTLKADQKGIWGTMNAQQMVEHFADSVKIANGRLQQPIIHEGEHLNKLREFLMSDIPFKENTKNVLLPEVPEQAKKESMSASIDYLQEQLDHFFKVNEETAELKTDNAFFGSLNLEQNIQLLYKHAKHHLKQFGIE